MVHKSRLNLFSIAVVLICLGIVMIYSASSIYAWKQYNDSFFFLKRHLIFMLLGISLAFLAMSIDYRILKRWAKPLLVFSVLLLILVLIPGVGREVSGARRWFRFGRVSFQPSELVNLAMIIYLADFISRKGDTIKTFLKGFLPPVLILGFVSMLILMQPDLGTTLALGVVTFLMLFIAGVNSNYLLYLIIGSLPALYVLIFSVPYRRMRILSFLNPWLDPKGSRRAYPGRDRGRAAS